MPRQHTGETGAGSWISFTRVSGFACTAFGLVAYILGVAIKPIARQAGISNDRELWSPRMIISTLVDSSVVVGSAKPARRRAGMQLDLRDRNSSRHHYPSDNPRVSLESRVHTSRKASTRRACIILVLRCCELPLLHLHCNPTRVEAP